MLKNLRNWLRGENKKTSRRTFFHLEALEERLCPAVDYWTNGGGDNKAGNPLNWDDGSGNHAVPGATTNVIFVKS